MKTVKTGLNMNSNFYNMNKSKVISEIFNTVLTKGIKSLKNDILGEDIDDSVYTKRVNINKDYKFRNGVDTVEVVCITLTCDNENMKDAAPRKVRINMRNRNNSWVNIFLHEAPNELIEFIYKNIK